MPSEETREAMEALTSAQARYLGEIREAGERSYNGRARKPIERLQSLGLIECDFELVPHADSGSGISFTERFTCRPVA